MNKSVTINSINHDKNEWQLTNSTKKTVAPLNEFAWATTRTVFPSFMSGMILFARSGNVRSIVSCKDSETGMQLGSRSLRKKYGKLLDINM